MKPLHPILAAALLVSCNPDYEVHGEEQIPVVTNAPPEVTIVSPEAGVRYYVDQDLLFHGWVEDAEDPPGSLVVQWSSSVDGVLPFPTKPTDEGETLVYGPLSVGEHVVTLTATDRSGQEGWDSVEVLVADNAPPECEITAPPDNYTGVFTDPVSFEGYTTDVDMAAPDLRVEWSSSLDGVLGPSVPADDGFVSLDWSALSIGTHAIELLAIDDVGQTCIDTIDLHVVDDTENAVPSAPVVEIYPSEPEEQRNDLLCEIIEESTDPDGDPITYTFAWTRNGAPFAAPESTLYVDDTIEAEHTFAYDIWTCTVTPNDGTADGPPGQDTVEVQPGEPVDMGHDTWYTEEVVGGGIVSEGLGLARRAGGPESGTIDILGVPPDAEILEAFAYWAVIGQPDDTLIIDGIPVIGRLVGTARDTCWGYGDNYVYWADIPHIVDGNGSYDIEGLDYIAGVVDGQGASIMVVYEDPDADFETLITVNEGSMYAGYDAIPPAESVAVLAEPVDGPVLKAQAHWAVGDAQPYDDGPTWVNGVEVHPNPFPGDDLPMWEDLTIDFTALGAVTPGMTEVVSQVSDASAVDCLIWVAYAVEVSTPL